jgi:hypothetical protein
MERHQELYADAVHPLDIAEVLERSGIGPQTAGRYRHADVFSLAEELHARVPCRAAVPVPTEGEWRHRARPALTAGVAFTLVALLLWGLLALGLPVPPGAQVAAFAAVAVPTLGRRLPLPERALLAVGVGGLLALAQGAGPPQVALAAGVGLAEWCARWYRHLGTGHVRSRSSQEFRSRMRPVLPAVVLVHLTFLAGLTAAWWPTRPMWPTRPRSLGRARAASGPPKAPPGRLCSSRCCYDTADGPRQLSPSWHPPAAAPRWPGWHRRTPTSPSGPAR